MCRDCPGGPVVKNSPPNAGNMGSIPGQGTKVLHALGQLTPRASARSLNTALKVPHAHDQKLADAFTLLKNAQRMKGMCESYRNK